MNANKNKLKTIQEYIDSQEPIKREYLYQIEIILQEVLKDAQKRISWGMPTFWKDRNIIHFAAAKTHIGLYPGPKAIEIFEKELQDYSTSKGTIRIPYKNPLPKELIQKIALWCYENR
ncbi:iron chaperone [Faecalicoccus pleomorphus]|uniref:iron chaperone n=1 Tax=Faecalicoccus pleomorphus TaxID=1323 RepID=UPI0039F5459E